MHALRPLVRFLGGTQGKQNVLKESYIQCDQQTVGGMSDKPRDVCTATRGTSRQMPEDTSCFEDQAPFQITQHQLQGCALGP